MSFSPDWLALREPVDCAARDSALLSRAAAIAGPDAIVLDLGSGTGSTARAFRHAICASWTWRFLDGDAGLLDIAKTRHPGSECVTMNLRDIDDLPLDGVGLVTASALLDLMPYAWMCQLAERLSRANIPFYAALNYDGQMQWTPASDFDQSITQSFNDHQQTDKGIGPAMGPKSGQLAAQALSEHGFEVALAQSPWQIASQDDELHSQLIAGIGDAADELGNELASAWVAKRTAQVATTCAIIGHTDVLAWPQAAV